MKSFVESEVNILLNFIDRNIFWLLGLGIIVVSMFFGVDWKFQEYAIMAVLSTGIDAILNKKSA
jgi:hypothetical protein